MSKHPICAFCSGKIFDAPIPISAREINGVNLGSISIHGSCLLEKIDPRILSSEIDIGNDQGSGLTSDCLANLIVDALLSPGLIPREKTELAISIVEEEINSLKAMGDY